MSLMKTLAKVAIGVAVAKGAKAVMQGGAKPTGGNGGLFGGPHSPQRDAMAGTPLEGIMDSVLGGGQQGGSGGLGGLLEGLGQTQSAGPGGLGDILGGLAKQSGGAGGLGDLLGGLQQGGGGLGGLLGGLAGAAAGGAGGSFGQVLNSQFDGNPEPAIQASAEQEAAAGLMLSAMLQAAKSDGKFDAAEQQKLMEKLGDVSDAERNFVNAELQKPMDVKGLAQSIPRGLEPQVYMMSVLGIDLDTNQEAQYLHELAQAVGLSKQNVNDIHDQMGVPRIYG